MKEFVISGLIAHPKPPGDGMPRSVGRATVMTILFLVVLLNQADRIVMSVAAEAVKMDLGLSDSELGWLGGLAFSILYGSLAIPVARLSDRFDRWRIISACLIIWSGMTVLCGAAQSFVHLFLARIGVGIGEAGCSPTAQSLVSDHFPPERRAGAVSLVMAAIPIGGLVGAAAGGMVIQHAGWRAAFIVMGIPGLILGALILLVLEDPWRARPNNVSAPAEKVPAFATVLKATFRHRYFVQMVIGAALVLIAGYSMTLFTVSFFVRRFDLEFGEAGIVYGLVVGLSGCAGMILGGTACDRLVKRSAMWYALVPALALGMAALLYALAFVQSTIALVIVFLIPATCCQQMFMAPTFGFLQNIVAPRMRATASAVVFTIISVVGGFGPILTGMIVDLRSAAYFKTLGGGVFAVACPGGRAPAGAAPTRQLECLSSLSQGTADALVLTSALFFWAAVHYALAARKMHQTADGASRDCEGAGAQDG